MAFFDAHFFHPTIYAYTYNIIKHERRTCPYYSVVINITHIIYTRVAGEERGMRVKIMCTARGYEMGPVADVRTPVVILGTLYNRFNSRRPRAKYCSVSRTLPSSAERVPRFVFETEIPREHIPNTPYGFRVCTLSNAESCVARE